MGLIPTLVSGWASWNHVIKLCRGARERNVSSSPHHGVPLFLFSGHPFLRGSCQVFVLLPRHRSPTPAHSASFLAWKQSRSHPIHARAAWTHFLFEVNHVEVYNNIKFPFTRFAGSALFLCQKTHSLARRALCIYLT